MPLNVWKECQLRFRDREILFEAGNYIASLGPGERVVVGVPTTDRRWIPQLVATFKHGGTKELEGWIRENIEQVKGTSSLPGTFRCRYGILVIPRVCNLGDPKLLRDAPSDLKGFFEILAGMEVETEDS